MILSLTSVARSQRQTCAAPNSRIGGAGGCLERADAAAALAASSKLENVRVQQLSAESTWRKMAAQANRLATERAVRESQKAADSMMQPDADELDMVD
jgi:hypothetical protein